MPTNLQRDLWNLNYEVTEGGLVVSDVRHADFTLASDLRVVRVLIDTEFPNSSTGANRRSFVLGSKDMPQKPGTGIDTVYAPPDSKFGYHFPFGLEATFESAEPMFGKGTNSDKLIIQQKYRFADYGKNPPHEPGAVLDATRLYPLVKFLVPASGNDKSKLNPRYLRVDYRLDFDVDNIDEQRSAFAANTLTAPTGGRDKTNLAGVFKDHEHLPNAAGTAATVARVVASVITSGPNVDSLFRALEKPLAYEIASYGWIGGELPASFQGKAPETWDNIHIWAAKAQTVSTPGAFHCVHMHWRWGAVSGDEHLGVMDAKILPAAGKAFQGLGWTSTRGGPLIDPRLPLQNIQFALTKNDVPNWQKQYNPSHPEAFARLFTEARAQPDPIDRGADLVLWMSFEVFRHDVDMSGPWGGHLFTHGLYFAHNPDATPRAAQVGGAYGMASNPQPTRTWRRYAI